MTGMISLGKKLAWNQHINNNHNLFTLYIVSFNEINILNVNVIRQNTYKKENIRKSKTSKQTLNIEKLQFLERDRDKKSESKKWR